MPRKQKNGPTMVPFRFKEGAVSKKGSGLELIRSESPRPMGVIIPEVVEPACDLCASPMVAQITVTSEGETFRDVPVCARHLNHLRMYIAAERAVEESKTA